MRRQGVVFGNLIFGRPSACFPPRWEATGNPNCGAGADPYRPSYVDVCLLFNSNPRRNLTHHRETWQRGSSTPELFRSHTENISSPPGTAAGWALWFGRVRVIRLALCCAPVQARPDASFYTLA